MLTRLSVKNFRLLRDVTIDVEPGKPVVLIGPNSSGKSSVLQVLGLLGRCASSGLEEALNVLGGDDAVVAAGEHAMTFEIEARRQQRAMRYGFAMLDIPLSLIGDEWLYVVPMTDDGSREERQVLSRRFDDFQLWNERTAANEKQSIAKEQGYSHLILELVKQRWFYSYLETLRDELAEIHIYDSFLTTPLWARDSREGKLSPFDGAVVAPVSRIDRRGLNLVNALYSLQNNHGDAWEELVHNFRAEFPFVQRLEFPPDPAGGRIALGWRDRRNPNVRMRGHQMSEGMTAYLCMLAAVLSPQPAAALAFDEPEAHLHPSALRRVAYLMEKASERSAVFVATHSDRFLDYLSDPAGSIHICEPSDQGVTIRKLDRDALDEWRKDYTLSELRERGYLDPANESGAES